MTTGRRHVCTCAVPVWRFDPPRGHRLSFGKPPPPPKKKYKDNSTICTFVYYCATTCFGTAAILDSYIC